MFAKLAVAKLDLFVEAPTRCILEYHVGGVFFLLVVVVDELDDVWMVQFVVDVNLLLCILVVDLYPQACTIFIATTSPFSVLRASFTSP